VFDAFVFLYSQLLTFPLFSILIQHVALLFWRGRGDRLAGVVGAMVVSVRSMVN